MMKGVVEGGYSWALDGRTDTRSEAKYFLNIDLEVSIRSDAIWFYG
jgi:hypothetical protein